MPKMEWKESVNLVFDYFCERTPRSFVEARDTSVVWNYKYAGMSTYIHSFYFLGSKTRKNPMVQAMKMQRFVINEIQSAIL